MQSFARTLFLALALFALLSVSNAYLSSSSSSFTGSSSVVPFSSTVGSPVIPDHSAVIFFYINTTNIPTTALASTSPLVTNLTLVIETNLANLANVASNGTGKNYTAGNFTGYVEVTAIGGYAVNYPAGRRLLQTSNSLQVTFVIQPAVVTALAIAVPDVTALASSFVYAAGNGTLTANVTGASIPGAVIPAQTVTVKLFVASSTAAAASGGSSSSSSGQGSSSAAFATASQSSAVLAMLFLVASLALLL